MTVYVFDLDDTLYHQATPFEKALTKELGQYRMVFEERLPEVYVQFRKHSDSLFPRQVSGELGLEEMRVKRIKETFQFYGSEISEKEAQAFQQTYQEEQGKLLLDEPMLEVLHHFKQNDVPRALLTNGPSHHQKMKIEALDLKRYFDADKLFISGTIGISKPAVQAFEHVAKHYPSHETFCYVGDSYENDIVGATQAGWQTIWLNKYQRQLTPDMTQPTIEVTTSKALKEVLLNHH